MIITAWKRVVLDNFAAFSGRATRGEYWWFLLASTLLFVGLCALTLVVGSSLFLLIWALYNVVVLVPNVAVSFRRIHDTGRSGWWLFVGFVPVVGSVALVVLLALPGDADANKYGPPPEGLRVA